jgi:hypothetical protein
MAQYINEQIAGAGDDSATIDWPGGTGVFLAQATSFNGMSLTLEFQIDGSTWTPVISPADAALTFTSSGMGYFELCPCKLRVAGTGGTLPQIRVRVAPARHGWFNDIALL